LSKKVKEWDNWGFIIEFMALGIVAPVVTKLIRDYDTDGAYEHLVEWLKKWKKEQGKEFPPHYEEALREYIEYVHMVTLQLGFCYDRRKKFWIQESLIRIKETFDDFGVHNGR